MKGYTLAELESWNQEIEAKVHGLGLDCFETHFEICSYEEMLNYEVYIGMPSHYPHWSYGKAFERLQTLYRYNLTGLPYEMVINADPCLAYLMADNSLLLQILTMAHVYGHNDFFKNNRLFGATRPELVVETFKNHAKRIRQYIQDPSIGYQSVERILNAAHAIRYQTQRTPGAKNLSREVKQERLWEAYLRRLNEIKDVEARSQLEPPDLSRRPLEPDEDLIGFLISDGHLEEWEKDILRIVQQETAYFIPQIETKILNEGWASFWHYRILQQLALEPDFQFEFLKIHHQVIRPVPGGLNPYHLGFTMLQDLERRYGTEKIFEARRIESDRSFIRRYLTRELCQELKLFEYFTEKDRGIVTEIADEDGWEQIRDTLSATVGLGALPVIRVLDASSKDRILLLGHDYDGRELELDYTSETLRYLVSLWNGPVTLRTCLNGRDQEITCDLEGRLSVREI